MSSFFYTRNVRPQTPLAAVLLTLFGATVVAGTGWEQEKITDDGIAVYSRTTAGTTVREVRASMSIAAPAKTVFDAVMDPATFEDTTEKYVEKNRLYHTDDPNVWYIYQLLDLPVISNRDYCLRYEKSADPEKGTFRITWRASKKFAPPPLKDVVRVSNIKGSFEVNADKSGRGSTLRYTLLADPGGNIPGWLINFANRRSLPDILRQVKDASLERVRKGKSFRKVSRL